MGKSPPEQSREQNQNAQKPNGVVVLGVFMHCQGCADKIVKCLRDFDGVEQIETDLKNHKVTVKGKRVDPEKVADWLRKKSNKHINLISPVFKQIKKEEKEEEKKEEPKVVEVVLKIYMHCESCAADVKNTIHKMQGVNTVETDMRNSQVTVKGVFDPKNLVEFMDKRAGKIAVIMKQTPPEKKKKKKEDKGRNGEQKEKERNKTDHQLYPPGLVYAPQIFSEENPNGCSVM